MGVGAWHDGFLPTRHQVPAHASRYACSLNRVLQEPTRTRTLYACHYSPSPQPPSPQSPAACRLLKLLLPVPSRPLPQTPAPVGKAADGGDGLQAVANRR